MKFENIKVGDTVFIKESVRFDYMSSRCFFVPVKVKRVTTKQFVTDNDRIFKKTGNEIGEVFSSAYELGEKAFYDKKISDETEERDAFKAKIKLEKEIMDKLCSIKIIKNSDHSKEKLNEVSCLIDKIIDSIK